MTRSLALPSPSTRKDSVCVMLLRFVTSITLVPAYLAEVRFNDSVENTDITLPNLIPSAHLEIDVKLPNNLCSGRAVDGDGFDWQTRTVEGELCC